MDIIPHNSSKKRIWDLFILVLTTYFAIEIPLWLVFRYPISGVLYWIDLFSVCSFIVDILLNFRTSIYLDGKFSKDPKAISSQYLRGWFFVDFLSAVPYALIVHANIIPTGWEFVGMLRLFRLLRLVKLVEFIRNWGYTEFSNPSVMRLSFLIFWILLISHWIGCGWIVLGGGVTNVDNTTRYIRAVYWGVTTLATVGYGDITPTTNVQTVYAIFIMLLGAGLYGYVIGNIANLLANIDIAKAQFMEKIEKINTFMNYKNLPDDLQDRVRNYYNYLWENKKGYDESLVMGDLPSSLKMDIALHLNSDLVRNIPILRGASDDLINRLVLFLKPVVFTPGDFIFRKGDIGHNLYFISKGAVEVVSDDGQTVYATLSEGSFFGEIALLMDTPRTASIRAIDYCDLYTLDKDTFDGVLKYFPDFAREIRQKAAERAKKRGVPKKKI